MPSSATHMMAAPATGRKHAVKLPDVPEALRGMADAGREAERLADALAVRVEASRARSERARTRHHGRNGHDPDVAIKLTGRGLEAVCRRCGKRVAA
jgi:hypothetical protein